MVFLIVIIAGDLGDILSFLFYLLLTLIFYSRSGINSSYGKSRLFALSIMALFYLFFFGLFKGLFGPETLFGLVGLIFSLKSHGFFVSLIITRIQTYLNRTFFFGVLLIQLDTSLNLGFGISFIGYTNNIVFKYLITNINNSQLNQRPKAITKLST